MSKPAVKKSYNKNRKALLFLVLTSPTAWSFCTRVSGVLKKCAIVVPVRSNMKMFLNTQSYNICNSARFSVWLNRCSVFNFSASWSANFIIKTRSKPTRFGRAIQWLKLQSKYSWNLRFNKDLQNFITFQHFRTQRMMCKELRNEIPDAVVVVYFFFAPFYAALVDTQEIFNDCIG